VLSSQTFSCTYIDKDTTEVLKIFYLDYDKILFLKLNSNDDHIIERVNLTDATIPWRNKVKCSDGSCINFQLFAEITFDSTNMYDVFQYESYILLYNCTLSTGTVSDMKQMLNSPEQGIYGLTILGEMLYMAFWDMNGFGSIVVYYARKTHSF